MFLLEPWLVCDMVILLELLQVVHVLWKQNDVEIFYYNGLVVVEKIFSQDL
jgi:hypothetical protein